MVTEACESGGEAGKSGVGLERNKNEKIVSLRVVVVLVVRGVNLGWIVKRRSKVV